MDLLALGAAFSVLITVIVVALAFMSATAATKQIRGRLEGVLSGNTSVVEGDAIDPLRSRGSVLGVYQAIISGAWLGRVEQDLRRAESQLQPIDFIAIRVAFAGVAFAAPYLFLGGNMVSILASLALGFIGFQLPQIWLGRRRAVRNAKLEKQLPDALTYIANSLKAGFGLLQSLDMASKQLEHPVSTELAQTVHETNVGSSAEEAFLALNERNESYDLDLVVTAILVQRSTGGNLAEILDTVAETMRERVRIKGEIETLTAQQKLTGLVIAGMPVGVAGLFLVVSPGYITVLFTDTIGQVMLGMAVVLETVGVLIIRRVLDIEV